MMTIASSATKKDNCTAVTTVSELFTKHASTLKDSLNFGTVSTVYSINFVLNANFPNQSLNLIKVN